MRARIALGALLLVGTVASAAVPQRLYVVSWGNPGQCTPERRALMEQFDRQLRDELSRQGAAVVDRKDPRGAIVLRPSLEVQARTLKLNLVGLRSSDQKLLGSASVKASGASRAAQLRALVKRACAEADQFD